jgi:hypothetical protein
MMFGNSSADPIRTMEIRYDRDKPSRAVTLPYIPGQDKSEVVPMWNNAINKSQKWKEFSAASQDYSQSGTDIPGFSTGSGGAFSAGSDFPGQGFGYQYQSPTEIAEAPRYIRIPPDLDSPAADKWLQEHPGTGNYQTAPQDFLRNKPSMQQKYRGVGAFPA